MTVDRWIRFVAGAFVLLSLALSRLVSPWFLLFTAFVGANLLQSSLTEWCPLTYLLRALGVQNAAACGVTPDARVGAAARSRSPRPS